MTAIQALPIEHLLVPLDGSHLAEAPLPAAIALAGRLGARVTLLHVLERDAPEKVHGERHLTDATEAKAYLQGVAARFAEAGVPVEAHVHPNQEGDVAASVAVHALALGADLIVLCTHGRGGPREWVSGSLAQQVVRRAVAPVLLIRPGAGGQAPPFAPGAVLVALDGTDEGELALPAALAIARAFGAPLRLVVVVATLGTISDDRAAAARLAPAATAAALDLEQDEAGRYLQRLRERLPAGDVPVEIEVRRGDAVRVVMDLAARAAGSVLAMATHGRASFGALWSGSIGSRLVARASNPLLLVRAAD